MAAAATPVNPVAVRLQRLTVTVGPRPAAGVAVRPFGAEGARVSIGDHDANDAFLSVAQAYPRRH